MPCNTRFAEAQPYHGKGSGAIHATCILHLVLCYFAEASTLSCFFSTIHFILGERILVWEISHCPWTFFLFEGKSPQNGCKSIQNLCLGSTPVTQTVEAKVTVILKLMTAIYLMTHMCYTLPFTISDLHGNILSWITFRNEELGVPRKYTLSHDPTAASDGYSGVKADCPSAPSYIFSSTPPNPSIE